jgi:hypothetical protein
MFGHFPKESHFLTRLTTGASVNWKSFVWYLNRYRTLRGTDGNLLAMDASPTYAWEQSFVPDALSALFPENKIMFVIQEPGRRAESDYYAFTKQQKDAPRSFAAYVEAEIKRISGCMCQPSPNNQQPAYCADRVPVKGLPQRQHENRVADPLRLLANVKAVREKFFQCGAITQGKMLRLGISFYTATMRRFYELFGGENIFVIFTQELSNQTVLAEL